MADTLVSETSFCGFDSRPWDYIKPGTLHTIVPSSPAMLSALIRMASRADRGSKYRSVVKSGPPGNAGIRKTVIRKSPSSFDVVMMARSWPAGLRITQDTRVMPSRRTSYLVSDITPSRDAVDAAASEDTAWDG